MSQKVVINLWRSDFWVYWGKNNINKIDAMTRQRFTAEFKARDA